MARNNRHNTAFVVGSVLGAVAGAAAALWKTPYSGEELRSKLTGAGGQGAAGSAHVTVADGGQRSLKDKVVSGVEKTLAPIVGVELDKTANGSGSLGSDIRVNRDVAGTGTTGSGSAVPGSGNVSVAHAADGSETIGLSRDKVDADKWAAAYKGVDLDASTDTSTTGQSTGQPVAPDVSAGTTSAEPTTLRHQHTWKGTETNPWASGTASTAETGGDVSTTHAADGSTMIGLSRDKVDAQKWAAAYAGEDLDAKDTASISTPTTSATGGSSGSSHGFASKEESAAQTGLGAKPAYPGNDQSGRQPVDNTAPEDSVGDVARGADVHTGRTANTSPVLSGEDAATTEQLSTPQVHRVPDSLRPPTEHGMHPFPKLGGKEDA